MPKNYNNAKIYIIRSYQTDDVYIGSTLEKLSKRIGSHRSHFRQYMNDKYHYLTSFKLIERDDHYIELYEEYPCENKEQLNKREGELIRSTPNCVNKCVAGNMVGKTEREYSKEYYTANINRFKEYYSANKDARLVYQNCYNRVKRYKKIVMNELLHGFNSNN